MKKEIDIDKTTISLKILNLQHKLAANSLQEYLKIILKIKQQNKIPKIRRDITIKRICQMEII